MAQFTIVIDDRERAVVPFFEQLAPSHPDVQHRVERLTVGDYAIMLGPRLLISVERKTWADLAASIKDNRKANMQKLIEARATTGCTICYLMEGRIPKSATSLVAGIAYKNLQAHLDHAAIRDGIHVFYTKDTVDTARRLFELTHNLTTLKYEAPAGGNAEDEHKADEDGHAVADGHAVITAKHPPSDELIIHNMWCSLPNVSSTTASVLIKENIHIKQVLLGEVAADQLAILKYPNGSILGTRGRSIAALSSSPLLAATMAKLLSSIPGISRKCAQNIIAAADNSATKLYQMTADELAAVKKGGDKKLIGSALAQKIQKYLNI